MDINKILKTSGYGDRHNFGDIAKWAHEQNFKNESDMLYSVRNRFGGVQPKIEMMDKPAPYQLWLSDELPVDGNAIDQLKTALSLPVAVGGAGMPDLHMGYSLPIGGVVVLDYAVSPAFVGYDISCMMQLTILNTQGRYTADDLEDEGVRDEFLQWVLSSTSFGLGSQTSGIYHKVMDHPLWTENKFLRGLRDLAASQLGSSGAGNHFCDIVVEQDGNWIGLLTHSGSRGVGNKVGHYYSELADKETAKKYKFPAGYGWFETSSPLYEEYMEVMQLMGLYAEANHDIIHYRFLNNAGFKVANRFSNKHNFAWTLRNGYVVHRKGATPALEGQVGIIPGSSGSPSFLVTGKGNPASWNSASHGAGRPFSRSEAKRRFDVADYREHMSSHGITSYGVAQDETVAAYKDINLVIQAQLDLIDVRAVMLPKVVVMGGMVRSDDGD